MGETVSLDDYTTLPGKSGATHSISLCIAGYGPTLCVKMREYQAQQRLIVKHIDGNKNPADLFTKPLPRPAFQEYCRAIGLVSGTKELVNENL